MSVEERVERIRAEQLEETAKRGALKKERQTESAGHARYLNSRLERLRQLQVVGIIEDFTKSSIRPVFIYEDRDIEAETKSPVPERWPTAEEIRLAFNKPGPKEWWSAEVQPPELNNQTLEWDTNLCIRIQLISNQVSLRRLGMAEKLGWIDFVWFNDSDLISVSGNVETYNGIIPEQLELRINTIEEAIAQAVVNPKREIQHISRPFDSHTPIRAQG